MQSGAHEGGVPAAETLVQQGIAALRQGDTTTAQTVLAQALLLNPRNDQAWLWLSGTMTDEAERRFCLERVLKINPQNAMAQKSLSVLPPGQAKLPAVLASPPPKPGAHPAAAAPPKAAAAPPKAEAAPPPEEAVAPPPKAEPAPPEAEAEAEPEAESPLAQKLKDRAMSSSPLQLPQFTPVDTERLQAEDADDEEPIAEEKESPIQRVLALLPKRKDERDEPIAEEKESAEKESPIQRVLALLPKRKEGEEKPAKKERPAAAKPAKADTREQDEPEGTTGKPRDIKRVIVGGVLAVVVLFLVGAVVLDTLTGSDNETPANRPTRIADSGAATSNVAGTNIITNTDNTTATTTVEATVTVTPTEEITATATLTPTEEITATATLTPTAVITATNPMTNTIASVSDITATEELTPEETFVAWNGYINNESAIRSEPRVAANTIIGAICPLDQVEVLEEQSDWRYVRILAYGDMCQPTHVITDTEGWVRQSLIATESFEPPEEYPQRPPDLTIATVVQVVDGDAIDVTTGTTMTLRVRLIGVDTPDKDPLQCFHPEAFARARKLMTGQAVLLESDPEVGDRDEYDQLLRYVWRPDGMLVNLELLAGGYAFPFPDYPAFTYATFFQQALQQAQNEPDGLWDPDACNGEREF